MFSGLDPRDSLSGTKGRGNWLRGRRTVAVSVAAHLTLLAAIVFHHERAVELTPTWVAAGDAAHSYQITYLPPGNKETPASEAKLSLPAKKSHFKPLPPAQTKKPAETTKPMSPQPLPPAQTQKPTPPQPPPPLQPKADEGTETARAGTPLGTVVDGPISGHDVHVAYPVVYPDPPVNRGELPRDLVGDVIIEVTIDSRGNVIETKIVQAIGHGIDEKIEATLRRWHYQPATLDGMPVASHHDVHFHFPS